MNGETIPTDTDVPILNGSTLIVGPLKFVVQFAAPKTTADEDTEWLSGLAIAAKSSSQENPAKSKTPVADGEETKDYPPSQKRRRSAAPQVVVTRKAAPTAGGPSATSDAPAESSEGRAKRDSAGAAAARDEANASFSREKANTLWQTFVRNRTWVVPTLVAMRTTAQQREAARRDLPGLAYLPPALRQSWTPNEIDKQVSPEVAKWYLAQFQNDMKLARAMHDAGVQMMAGSDSLDPFNFPGASLHDELKLLTEVGFTSQQALQAATSKPAEFIHASSGGGWGTIEPGKIADLVLLEADPLVDIANTRKIAAVILGGRFLGRNDLDQMLSQARGAAEAVK